MKKDKAIKRLVRPREGRWLGGVALGMADYLGIDVTVVRLFWIFLFIPGGLPGLLPYIVMWIVIPEE